MTHRGNPVRKPKKVKKERKPKHDSPLSSLWDKNNAVVVGVMVLVCFVILYFLSLALLHK
jgi:hypothetical protein